MTPDRTLGHSFLSAFDALVASPQTAADARRAAELGDHAATSLKSAFLFAGLVLAVVLLARGGA